MVQHHVTWDRQSVIKKAFLYQVSLLVVLVVYFRELLVVQRNVLSVDKVVVEMNWKDLGVLHWLLGILRQILVVNIVGSLFSLSVRVFCLGRVRVLRLFLILRRAIMRLCWCWFHCSCNSLLHLLLLNLLLL